MSNLNGKYAVVTGGSKGIGAAIVRRFMEDGAAGVAILEYDYELAGKTAGLIDPTGEKVLAINCDVSIEDQVAAAIQTVMEKFKRIDILVNNAGITKDAMFHKMTNDAWNDVINVNLNGTYYTCKYVVPIMRERSYGRIVNIASVSAFGLAGQANYSASKGAIISLTAEACCKKVIINNKEGNMKLKGKVAVITGGSRGLGKAIAQRFLEEGAVVIITATKENKLRETAEELSRMGSIEGILMNVSQFNDVQKTMGYIFEKYGKVDILVNNAGITADSQLVNMTEDQFDSVIAVNLKGVFNCAKAAAVKMIESGYGRIINISSVTAHNGNFGQTNYTASKAGVIAMTQTWAKELGKRGITVNAVAPGYTLTEMVEAVPEKAIDAIKEKTPVKRLGKPEEIAAACVYLSSDEAAFVTGAVLKVDGGLVL